MGTPAVAGNILLEVALDVFAKTRLSKLFERHAALTQLLIKFAPKELERRRVMASVRPPDILRFGLSPLYHREADVRELVRRLDNAVSAIL